ncbi:NAD(P)H-dependent oxidoreductase [Mycoplasmopsis lipofaciens]|uniref:NAD(P)H-dependent oxidoreductase n=1 Tax=Mycoplasmopsis lipofaciens TaxID=114884 RepID=UPI000488C177|nr:NAD(P)H-dependent oxidoreductase [Mycoplasmopsis lipofaciens]
MKKILIINCDPILGSFNEKIAKIYYEESVLKNNQVKILNLRELDFEINLKNGYKTIMELEPDLKKAWYLIKESDHLVFIHPVWWGGFPALMKGFIDRIFLPGQAFKFKKNSNLWEKYLINKTAHILTTCDSPKWAYKYIFKQPGVNQLKKCILNFCGIKVKKTYIVGSLKFKNDLQKKKVFKKIQKIASKI